MKDIILMGSLFSVTASLVINPPMIMGRYFQPTCLQINRIYFVNYYPMHSLLDEM